MKKKIVSLLLAFALPLSSCNFNFCSANGYYEDYTQLEYKVKNLQDSLDKLEKEKEIKQLEEKLQKLEKDNKNQENSSIWASIKRVFKDFFSTNLGIIGGACATIGTLAAVAAVLTGGVAVYDCCKDDQCHFTDESFFKKFNAKTFKKFFSSIADFSIKYMKNVHFIRINSDK